jgi:hypothetical protein
MRKPNLLFQIFEKLQNIISYFVFPKPFWTNYLSLQPISFQLKRRFLKQTEDLKNRKSKISLWLISNQHPY